MTKPNPHPRRLADAEQPVAPGHEDLVLFIAGAGPPPAFHSSVAASVYSRDISPCTSVGDGS